MAETYDKWQLPSHVAADGEPKVGAEFLQTSPDVADVAVAQGVQVTKLWMEPLVRLMPFSHPYVCSAREVLYRHGVRGLRKYDQLTPPLQAQQANYLPPLVKTQHVANEELLDEFEFHYGGAFSTYNWELFFHSPMLIASWLMRSGRHEEAREWMHAVYHPTGANPGDPGTELWGFKPFRGIQDIADLQEEIGSPTPTDPVAKWLQKALGGGVAELESELTDQIAASIADPFNPHGIARLRPLAYMKWTARLYIENLVAWGDQLFRRDTVENIVEAQQLYMLAARLLGPRPNQLPPAVEPEALTFEELEPLLDDFSNALVQLESVLPVVPPLGGGPPGDALTDWVAPYFCVPFNDHMLSLWDTVADRLFKIRHCMNIEGIERQLPLFEPPIDPALLVRAKAAGLDLASVLNDLHSPPPLHRFQALYGRALDFAGFVSSLGGQLLSAIEKKDAETLGLLRSTHEVRLLEQVRETRRQQIREAEEAADAVRLSKAVAEQRRAHYAALLDTSPSPGTIGVASGREKHAQELTSDARTMQDVAAGVRIAGQALFALPQLGVSVPFLTVEVGGLHLGNLMTAVAEGLGIAAQHVRDDASEETLMAGYDRRAEDWNLQLTLAEGELKQLDKQIIAAEIRVAIANLELANHDRQLEQAREVREFLEDKFSNEDLYLWMQGELQSTYHQAYKLAFDLARRAERAYQYERAEPTAQFVQFGHWDGVRKGLLAGEKLALDLRRMDVAYLDKDRREYELTKSISLAEVAPLALIALRETGSVTLDIAEGLFDLDYPGHYHRRIKNASITIAGVTGPYTSINCTLTLLASRTRFSSVLSDGAYDELPNEDPRFRYSYGAVGSVCTSQAQGDSGMFELSFREEKLLPFEGAGAISRWRIDLPAATNRFDLHSVSDVILQLQYTAREGGGVLRNAALKAGFESQQPRALRLLSLKSEHATAWEAFENELDESDNQVLAFTLDEKVPFIPGRGPVRLRRLHIAFKVEHPDPVPVIVAAGLDMDALVSTVSLGLRAASVAWQVVDEPLDPAVEIEGETLTVSISQTTLEGLDGALVEEGPIPETLRLKRSVFEDLIVIAELERDPLLG